MERVHPSDDRAIVDVRFIDGRADQRLAKHLGAHVQDALAIPISARGAPVVDDVWGEDRHSRTSGAPMLRLKVVPDRAVVDDEHRPRVVGVRGIRVV
jgi:hypothetical protein